MKKKSTSPKSKKQRPLAIIQNDPWLEPYAPAIEGRHNDFLKKEAEALGGSGSLVDFANAHKYFGMHRTPDGGWVFREWGTERHCHHPRW